MSSIDFIKESIYCDTIVRDKEYTDSATKAYYDDLLRALSIEDFPLIEINTINKQTYMFESVGDKRFYLVFDHYFLDCIHEINQIIMDKHGSVFLNSFLDKTMAEECYCNRRYALSIQFAGQYLNTLDSVIKEYDEKCSVDSLPNALFIQQAFLIAHELFHYVLNKDASLLSTGKEKKRQFINSLKNTAIEDLLKKYIDDQLFLEECLCDATGLIQAIDIARSLGKMDVAEAAAVSVMAIMGQITISTIKVDDSREFMHKTRGMYASWLVKIQIPIIEKLKTYKKDFQNDPIRDSLDIEELNGAKQVLMQIFNI